jgi:hypothetical protein
MQIDPSVEEPTRDLLEKVIRREYQEVTEIIKALGESRSTECLSLCLSVAGYIVIDVCGHRWPTDSELRRIAQLMSENDLGCELPETDAYHFLARAALGFEPLTVVFSDMEKSGPVPILSTASLLVAYRPDGQHWREYLDVIESGLEEAAPLSQAAFPAALLLARRARTLESEDSAGRAGPASL